MSGARRLIVNADDFGRTAGINRGILQAHLQGIVTSTTLMVNQPATEEATTFAKEYPHLGVGLHLTLCDGAPLASAVPSLTDAGGAFIRNLERLAERINPDDVRHEIEAQHRRFLSLVGRQPTHIDSHKHLHGWPVIRKQVIELARLHGLPVRACDAETGAALRTAGVTTTDHFETGFFDETARADHLIEIIRILPPGSTELMCHPGIVDAGLKESSYREPRELEIAALSDPGVRAVVDKSQVELITFTDL
jgi:chitin disaccharide deacetylase